MYHIGPNARDNYLCFSKLTIKIYCFILLFVKVGSRLVQEKEKGFTAKHCKALILLAEGQGFEPWVPCGTTDFESVLCRFGTNTIHLFVLAKCLYY